MQWIEMNKHQCVILKSDEGSSTSEGENVSANASTLVL